MTATTHFLVQLIGPTLSVMALGILSDPTRFQKIMKNLRADSLSLLITGLLTMVAGTAIVLTQNTWNTPVEIVVSLFGWVSILKGAWILLAPKNGIEVGNKMKDNYQIVGVVALLLGLYLSWAGYLMR